MKINSNTFTLEKEAYEELESIITKIAEDNDIDDIEEVQIKISSDEGVVSFKEARKRPAAPGGNPMTVAMGGTAKKEKKKKKDKEC